MESFFRIDTFWISNAIANVGKDFSANYTRFGQMSIYCGRVKREVGYSRCFVLRPAIAFERKPKAASAGLFGAILAILILILVLVLIQDEPPNLCVISFVLRLLLNSNANAALFLTQVCGRPGRSRRYEVQARRPSGVNPRFDLYLHLA